MKIAPIQQQNNMNFQAMKPSQFKGFDYAVVRKFKAPVEKFNENADFQAWAKKQFSATINKLFGGRSQEVMLERISYLLLRHVLLSPSKAGFRPAPAVRQAVWDYCPYPDTGSSCS